jgi:hypothetical protein
MTVKERIIRISNEIEVNKGGFNTYSEYEYIRPDDLQIALKPLYLKYRLFAHFNLRKLKDGKNEAILRIEDFDSDVGRQIYSMVVEDITMKAANSAQNVGGLRTYCNRYLLMTAFNISSNEDDLDNEKNSGGDKKPKESTKKNAGEDAAMKNLINICKEKAVIDRDAVVAMITKYHNSGVVNNVKGIDNINKLMDELKTITGGK